VSESLAETLPASFEVNERAQVRVRLARILTAFIFYSLLIVIALTAVPYGTVQPWWESFFESAVFALAALSVVEIMLTGLGRVAKYRLLLPLLALMLFAFIQTLPLKGVEASAAGISSAALRTISADPFETRIFILKVAAISLVLALLVRYTNSRRRLGALIFLIIMVGVVSALFGIIRQTTQHQGPGFVLPYLMPNSGYAQFINKNHFAFLMEMVLGLILGFLVAGGARRDRVLIYVAAAAPVWSALVLCLSRGGILSMLSQVIFLALLFNLTQMRSGSHHEANNNALLRFGRSLVFRLVLIVGLVAAIFVGMVWVGGESLVNRFQNVPEEAGQSRAEGGSSRAEIWRATWRMFESHPILGEGFNGYWIGITQYHDATGQLTPQQAHNDYLEILASGGLIGIAIFIWLAVLIVREVRKALAASDSFRRATITGACVGIFGVMVHSFVDFGLHITVNCLILVALVVIATAEIPIEKYRGRAIIER